MMLLTPDAIYCDIFEHVREIHKNSSWLVCAVSSSLRSLLASASKAVDDI